MAEKYGVIPKRFTREWWEYFWMYYKWHTIVIAFIIIIATVTVYQKITSPKYDLTLTMAVDEYIPDESISLLESELTPVTEDVNGNGESLLFISFMNMYSGEESDPQYLMAMSMKLQIALSEDDTYIFILDEERIKAFAGDSVESSAFAKVESWADSDIREEDALVIHGDKIAVSLKGNKYLEDAGIDTEDKYLVMRYYPRESKKDQIPGYKAAIKLANEILS